MRELLWGICALVVVSGMSACSDFLENESHHTLPDEHNWNTLEDARAGLMGMYGLMRAALADNNTHWACGELRSGDFTAYGRADLDAIIHNDLNRNIPMIDEISDWRRFYAVVNAASVFIENVGNVLGQDKAYSEQTLKWDVAQARALRGLAYFYMVRIWGDVPLVTCSYDNGSFPKIGCSPAAKVLQYAKSELLAAASELPFQFGMDNNRYYRQNKEYWQGRLLNKLSVYAILAHLSAWEGNYSDAEAYAAYVVDNCEQIGIDTSDDESVMPVNTIVDPVGLFNSSYQGACRLVAFNFDYISSNLDVSQSGHLEQWTLCDPYVPKSQQDLYVSKDTLFAIYDNWADQRFGIDTASSTKRYVSAYVDMASAIPIFKKINVVQNGQGKDPDFAVFGSSIVL